MILPASITTMLSASRIVEKRCAMVIVVRPRDADCNAVCTAFSDLVSNAEVASSKMRTVGSRIRARAIAMRCFCPDESP
ncbi:hypothetical protein N431DRAFT_407394 [Stipitochalara longipes BDJ]|nr:hypothetical protein N431DRAFT_407394 [Stipitochalara longipes BDJ]